MIEAGAVLSEFSLLDQDGVERAWSSLRGQPVVVFCYPKASTPGCTTEACRFRDLKDDFDRVGVRVIGLSADSVKAQRNFHSKYGLTMPLWSDPEHRVLDTLGAWGAKRLYGREYEGIIRSTFLFDADGKVVKTWPKVKVAGHAEVVLETARSLFSP